MEVNCYTNCENSLVLSVSKLNKTLTYIQMLHTLLFMLCCQNKLYQTKKKKKKIYI